MQAQSPPTTSVPCYKKPILSTFLCRLTLKRGALVTGQLMLGVFLVVGISFLILTIWWSHFYPELVETLGTTDPGADTNPMLDALYPVPMGAATAVFLLYSFTGGLLIYGVKKDFGPFVRLFLVTTIFSICFCLAGHIFIFAGYTWHDRKQLAVVLGVNVAWYLWWIYSLVVVYSYCLEKNQGDLLEADANSLREKMKNIPGRPAYSEDESHEEE